MKMEVNYMRVGGKVTIWAPKHTVEFQLEDLIACAKIGKAELVQRYEDAAEMIAQARYQDRSIDTADISITCWQAKEEGEST